MTLPNAFRWLRKLVGLVLLASLLPFPFLTHAQDNTAQTILTLLNAERNADGLASLSLNAQLTAAAQRHSDDMAAGDFLDHVGSDGSQFWDRILEAGYPMSSGAENILYRWDTSPLGAFTQWQESPQHAANMMSTDYTEVGIAWAQSASGKYYFTMVLARPQGVEPPTAAPRQTEATPTLPPLLSPTQPAPSAEDSGVSVLERLLQWFLWVQNLAAGSPAPAPPTVTAAPPLPAPPTATTAPIQPPAIPTATLPPAQPPTLSPILPPTAPPTVPPIVPPTIPPPTVAAPPTQAPAPAVPDVRIFSDGQSVAVLNVSGRPLDLRPLRMQSGAGALDAILWDNGYLSAPLNTFPAGDCLQVWSLAVPNTLPQPPQCNTRHAWLSVGSQYAFWEGVLQFQVLYGGRVVAVCQVGIPCDVSFSASAQPLPAPTVAALPPTSAAPASGPTDVRLLYDTRGVTLLNVSGRALNLAPLLFQSTTGTMPAGEWDNGYLSAPLSAFPAGDCLQVWNFAGTPLTPPAECRTRHAWLEMGTPYQFWHTDFQVFYGGQLLATCPLGAGICDLQLP